MKNFAGCILIVFFISLIESARVQGPFAAILTNDPKLSKMSTFFRETGVFHKCFTRDELTPWHSVCDRFQAVAACYEPFIEDYLKSSGFISYDKTLWAWIMAYEGQEFASAYCLQEAMKTFDQELQTRSEKIVHAFEIQNREITKAFRIQNEKQKYLLIPCLLILLLPALILTIQLASKIQCGKR